jgi:hypothetical protein
MRRLVSLALALTIVACSNDSTTEPTNASVAGTWTLQTINGAPLPFTVSSLGTTKIEAVSAVFVVSANGTWTGSSQTRTTVSGQASTSTTPDAGTYTLSGSTIALRSNDGTVETGTISGNTLVAVESGFTFVFTKQ